MKMFTRWIVPVLTWMVMGLVALEVQAAPPIKVSSATPATGEQGTLDLDVEIDGSGFEAGAAVDFFVTGGETDRGNVVVKSVTYVSSTKLRAKVSLENAKLADFDVKVTLMSGRNGKGITLFKVVAKGGGNTDATAPGPIGSVTVSPLALALRLTFVAPGDDGSAGTASGYGLEYKSFAGDCTGGGWTPAPNIDNARPATGGMVDSVPVQGLSPGTAYCVRVRARDEALNWSSWTELTAATTTGPWSTELVAGPRFDASGKPLVATRTAAVRDVDGVTTHVAWASRARPEDSSTTVGHRVTIATGGDGVWTLRDAVQNVAPSRLVVRARPGGGVGAMVLGYVVSGQQNVWRVTLVETAPTAGGYTLTESTPVEGTTVTNDAGSLAYGADGTLWFAYVRWVATSKRTGTTQLAIRRRDLSGLWTEQPVLTPSVKGPELVVAPDGGLAIAASACKKLDSQGRIIVPERTLYGRQDPVSGAWAFYRSAPTTTAYFQEHAIAFETTGAASILATSTSYPGSPVSSVIRYRSANLEPDPVLTVAASQLPASLDAICASPPPSVEPQSPETVVVPDLGVEPAGSARLAGVSADDSGVHVRAIRWTRDLPTLLTVSDCGSGWQAEEPVDIGHVGYGVNGHADPVVDANGDVFAAYSPEPQGSIAIAWPASSIRFTKRVGNACSGPP